MKTLTKLLLLICLFSFSLSKLHAQNSENAQDTLYDYLLEKAKILLKPHANLNFTFGTEELKNESPDLKVTLPDLKDTTKYLDELKGDFKDWFTFYKIGNLYQKFNRNQSALAHFEQAYSLILNEIKKDSLNSKYYSEMGMLYMSLKSNDNAYYFFNKAYELNEKDSLASQFLPMFLIFSGQLDQADKIIKRSVENKTDELSTYIWMVTSMIYRTLSEIDKSDESVFDKTIDEIYDFSEINKIISSHKTDIRFSVLEQLSRQLALFAKYGAIMGDFEKGGISKNDQKELKNIKKSIEKIISKNRFKNHSVLYKALGFNYLLSKDLDGSLEMFEKSIKYKPADQVSEDYYILFSTQFFLKHDTVKALEILDTKIKNDSALLMTNVGDFTIKGNIYLTKGDYANAIASYNKALEIGPVPDAWLGLAYINMKDKKLQEANVKINKAYDLNQNYYLTYALFGIVTIMNNQLEDAGGAIKKAMELKPGDETLEEINKTFFNN